MLKKPCKTNESVNWQSSPRGVISVLKNYELDFHLLSFILKGFWEELSHYLYMTPQPALRQPTPTNQSSFLTLPISSSRLRFQHKHLACIHILPLILPHMLSSFAQHSLHNVQSPTLHHTTKSPIVNFTLLHIHNLQV